MLCLYIECSVNRACYVPTPQDYGMLLGLKIFTLAVRLSQILAFSVSAEQNFHCSARLHYVWGEKLTKCNFLLQNEIQQYGIDWAGPVSEETDAEVHVEVPLTRNPLNEAQFQELTREIDPLKDSDCYGIDIFVETLEKVNNSIGM